MTETKKMGRGKAMSSASVIKLHGLLSGGNFGPLTTMTFKDVADQVRLQLPGVHVAASGLKAMLKEMGVKLKRKENAGIRSMKYGALVARVVELEQAVAFLTQTVSLLTTSIQASGRMCRPGTVVAQDQAKAEQAMGLPPLRAAA